MAQNDTEWRLELEESAQGTDLFEAPGSAVHAEDARQEATDWNAGVESSDGPGARVEKARARRHSLAGAMTTLESVVASPAAAAGWLEAVGVALDGLRSALEEHMSVTEGHEGLLAEIVEVAPRLSTEVELVKSEHGELLETLERAHLTLTGAIELGIDDPEPIRRRIMTLLGRLSLHRQRGADLVYEAYNVDIATAD